MRFGRKGSKTVLLSPLLSFYIQLYIHSAAGLGFARSEYSYSQGHSGKLQIVDLLYLRQLNEAILLFNSIALQFFLICLLSLLYLSNSGRSKNNDVNSS